AVFHCHLPTKRACAVQRTFTFVVALFLGVSSICVGRRLGHEGLVSHRSAVRGRNVRHHPDLTASNAKWSRAECRSRPGDHLWTLPSSSPTGVQTCLPPGLLWGFVLGPVWLLLTSVLGVNRTANRQS